jgi:hypothetical protein
MNIENRQESSVVPERTDIENAHAAGSNLDNHPPRTESLVITLQSKLGIVLAIPIHDEPRSIGT